MIINNHLDTCCSVVVHLRDSDHSFNAVVVRSVNSVPYLALINLIFRSISVSVSTRSSSVLSPLAWYR